MTRFISLGSKKTPEPISKVKMISHDFHFRYVMANTRHTQCNWMCFMIIRILDAIIYPRVLSFHKLAIDQT